VRAFGVLFLFGFFATWGARADLNATEETFRYWCEPKEPLLELEVFRGGLELVIRADLTVEFYIGNPGLIASANKVTWDNVRGYLVRVIFLATQRAR
jgi:hypothetical protein